MADPTLHEWVSVGRQTYWCPEPVAPLAEDVDLIDGRATVELVTREAGAYVQLPTADPGVASNGLEAEIAVQAVEVVARHNVITGVNLQPESLTLRLQ